MLGVTDKYTIRPVETEVTLTLEHCFSYKPTLCLFPYAGRHRQSIVSLINLHYEDLHYASSTLLGVTDKYTIRPVETEVTLTLEHCFSYKPTLCLFPYAGRHRQVYHQTC
ncbi:hypothetical protein RRG08_022693 [Elysia crispata]|uniref:Uncharacterized protein n=1 Tax=Elysia crispata TaxID=231223 RepID=A0AAE0ZE82_9GAST|nr:hypothetical protein RRG08_022693 [Elysia crispata]